MFEKYINKQKIQGNEKVIENKLQVTIKVASNFREFFQKVTKLLHKLLASFYI